MIRRGLIAVALAGLCLNAYAAKWELVTDSAGGSRLIADADSFKIEKYNKTATDESYRALAKMSMIQNNTETVVLVIIDALECANTGSGLMVTKVVETNETLTHFWTVDGPKMYDAQGVWLCGKVLQVIKQPKTQKKPTTKQPNTKSENKTTI